MTTRNEMLSHAAVQQVPRELRELTEAVKDLTYALMLTTDRPSMTPDVLRDMRKDARG